MSAGGIEELVDGLRDRAGDALRVVATYDREGYHAAHVRDDVDARVQQRAGDIHEDLILEGIGREHLEDLFEAGDLHCSMHRFDDLTAFHFVDDAEYSGLFVSLDSDADVALASFADECREWL